MSARIPQTTNDVCVLGLGRTGEALTRHLLRHPDAGQGEVWVFGGASSKESDASRELSELGAHVVLGTEELPAPTADGAPFDKVIVSPGIPPASGFFQAGEAASREGHVIGEVEYAWRVSPERWLTITGTNGKTTTTALTEHLMRASGLPARAVGNIGTPAVACVGDRAAGEWFVAELSSFQLATTYDFRPRAAALLNVTPDHLAWHGTMEAYAEAKERMFQNMGGDDLAVVSIDDPWCKEVTGRLESRGVRCAQLSVMVEPAGRDAAYLRAGGMLTVRLDGTDIELVHADDLLIKGEHNVQNALAASTLALAAGADADAVREGLVTFSALEHRIEPCGELGGVRFVNDSKATNTDSVEKALTAFEPGTVILLAGGHDKGSSLDSLSAAVCASVRVAVCFGAAGQRFYDAFSSQAGETGLKVILCERMADALAAGYAAARPGDVVLLSPACASFDEFSGFEERGRVFKGMVADLIAQGGDR